MRALLLAIILVLVLELVLLVWLSQHVSAWTLFGLLLLGGTLGASLAKRQGLRVFRDWQAALASGQPPREGALEGMLALVSGVLFVLPGLLSDVLGIALLFAPVRRRLAKALRPLFGVENLASFVGGVAPPGRAVGPTPAGSGAPGHGRSPGRARPAQHRARWDDGHQVVDTEGEAVNEPLEDDDDGDGAPRQLH
jgi:UPF0716 protein FxsA